MPQTLSDLAASALADLGTVFRAMPDDAADALIEAILSSRRICLYGAGREGLALRGFAMRLFHMGRDAHVVADMTTPPVSSVPPTTTEAIAKSSQPTPSVGWPAPNWAASCTPASPAIRPLKV